jgi:hypothetical protein
VWEASAGGLPGALRSARTVPHQRFCVVGRIFVDVRRGLARTNNQPILSATSQVTTTHKPNSRRRLTRPNSKRCCIRPKRTPLWRPGRRSAAHLRWPSRCPAHRSRNQGRWHQSCSCSPWAGRAASCRQSNLWLPERSQVAAGCRRRRRSGLGHNRRPVLPSSPLECQPAGRGCRPVYFGMSVSAGHLEATVIMAAVAGQLGVNALVNMSHLTVSQMSIQNITPSIPQR